MFGRLRNLFSGGGGGGDAPDAAPPPPDVWLPGWQPRPPADPEWRLVIEQGRFSPCGRVHRSLHMPDEAYASLRLDLAIAESVVGPRSHRLVELLVAASATAFSVRDLVSSASFAQRILDMVGDPGVTPADLATAETKLGDLDRAHGAPARAMERYRRALQLREEFLGPDNPHTERQRNFLARAEADPERVLDPLLSPTDLPESLLAQAEESRRGRRLLEAEEIAREAYNEAIFAGSCGPLASRACLLLADILADQGLTGDAQKYLFHHADIEGLLHGLDAPETAAALDRLERNTDIIRSGAAWQREESPGIEAIRDETHLHAWLMPRLLRVREDTAPRLRWGMITEAHCDDMLGQPLRGAPDSQAALVAFDVGVDGTTAAVEIVESSGSPLIDDRLRVLTAGLALSPAREAGQAVPSRIRQRILIHDGSFGLATPDREEVENNCVALVEGGDEGRDLWVYAPACGRLPRPARRTRGEFFGDDYPAEALDKGEEGSVRADFTISKEGRIEDIRVTESSGSAALDARTCEILAEHFEYEPARDAMGNAVQQASHQVVTWRLPEE